jgi:hypothetical protein
MNENKNSTIIVTIFIILVVIAFGVWIYSASTMNTPSSASSLNVNSTNSTGSTNSSALEQTNPNATNPNVQNTSPASQLFSDSPFALNAYLISTPTYDANTKKALAGFTVTKKTMADGSMQITLNATNPEYQTQTYTVQPGEKLYFIENNLKDDSGNTDKFTADDQAVLVDANGYIVVGGK